MVLKMIICCLTNTLETKDELVHPKQSSSPSPQRPSIMSLSNNLGSEISIHELSNSIPGSNLIVFSHDELRVITNNFSLSNFLGEGGFGAVYKGFIHDSLKPGLESQAVAVKVLDLEGTQGHKEWLAEVIYLGQLRHPHLVKLIGYSYDNDQRLLVYEYMARGNLDKQLFSRHSIPLPWLTRLKIALEAAKGLSFLHDLKKPVIFRDFKAANILLDTGYTAKLSDFGFARDGPEEDKTHVSTKNIVGTKGYTAPEYIMTGHLTTMSDVYSFGVVLLELLTGRRSMDKTRPKREQSLVDWARPMIKDPRKIEGLMDPRLEGQYSIQGSIIAAKLTYQCLSKRPKLRPRMSEVIRVLEPLLGLKDMVGGPFVYVAPCYKEQSLVSQVGGEKDVVKEKEEEKKENKTDDKRKQAEEVKKKNQNMAQRLHGVHSDSIVYKAHRN